MLDVFAAKNAFNFKENYREWFRGFCFDHYDVEFENLQSIFYGMSSLPSTVSPFEHDQ